MNHSQKQIIYLFAIGFLLAIVESQLTIKSYNQFDFSIIEELNCVFYRSGEKSFSTWTFKFFVQNDNYDSQLKPEMVQMYIPYYYIDNNQVNMNSNYGGEFISFDLRVDFKDFRIDFQNSIGMDFYCSAQAQVKKYGQYYYFVCLNGYIFQHMDYSDLGDKSQIFKETKICFHNYQDYMILDDILIYKSYIINFNSLSIYQCYLTLVDVIYQQLFQNYFPLIFNYYKKIIIKEFKQFQNNKQKQFDLFVYIDASNIINICQLDVNSNNFQCLKYLRIGPGNSQDFNNLFISKVIQSNGINLFLYALQGDKTYTLYDFSAFTVLQTSGQIKDIDNINNSIQIQNVIMVYQQQNIAQKIIFRYNIHTQKVDITQLDWKNSQYTFSNKIIDTIQPAPASASGILLNFKNDMNLQYNYQSEITALQLKASNTGQLFIIIWNRNFILAICRDYCIDCQQAIDNQQCQQCLLSYFLQPDNITCEKSCPSLSIQNNANLTCDCVQNAILINNQCQCDSQSYMDGNACIQCSIPNCIQCKDSITCMKCQQGYYFFEDFSCNTCNISNGYYIKAQNCFRCFHSCLTCEGPNQNQCLSCKLPDFYMFQDKLCKPCDVKNGYFINNQNCLSCFENCKTCLGANQNQCTSCYEGYDSINNFCQQIFLTYKSQIFTEQKIEQIQHLSSSTSSALVVSTTVMNLIQNIGSNSSFGILISSLTIQKLAYLYLLNVNLPKQIYSALEILSANYQITI
ncbi:transmembrane protein, putative (macronuclear) [Tetrahymena thermophila SB210]|uniref:Transmembrane protein, putative n=1 Tax=Tetrahymena thermophila (strain SB210) TaxID=312017 RepID=I7M063_TETTS|nr:transmembrane protein, putative [Tetrahymena thermophila SB210]EAR85556.3 transmembrane protein, putative [Tetrahymena thermophila SB210]|eukprot:XP_001033219.3 transmembrane protein, putative [Tetrahymena thermophila SB210]